VWATARLLTRERLEILAAERLGPETDEDVRTEWRRAVSPPPFGDGDTARAREEAA
jgi:hypothetical protein